jgi:two-component system OmpR family sensor kinase
MTSIRRRLLVWLCGGLLLVFLIASLTVYRAARSEANELFDYELQQIAATLPRAIVPPGDGKIHDNKLDTFSDDLIVIQTWDANGYSTYVSAQEFSSFPYHDGLRDEHAHGSEWRIYGMHQANRLVQISQPIAVRRTIAARIAWRTVWPLLALLPVTAVLIWFLVGRGLKPVSLLSESLELRSANTLAPILMTPGMPIELKPLAIALNHLLARLDLAQQAQRTFVADAAHELRTPLTALKLQLQLAERDGAFERHPQLLYKLDERLNRTIHLVQQLLTLAREDSSQGAKRVPINMSEIAAQVVSDFSLQAEQRRIDLGLILTPAAGVPGRFVIEGEPHALAIMLSNLVANAVNHVSAGGHIDVHLHSSGVDLSLEVMDDGPGIAQAELGRVMDRFFRGEHTLGVGSGLGLAIASRIAEKHGATLSLMNRHDADHGLSARIFNLKLNEA